MQSVGIHDPLNAQGFAMHCRVTQVFKCERMVYFSVLFNREAAESKLVIQLAINVIFL